jgi:hypothetical protein
VPFVHWDMVSFNNLIFNLKSSSVNYFDINRVFYFAQRTRAIAKPENLTEPTIAEITNKLTPYLKYKFAGVKIK